MEDDDDETDNENGADDDEEVADRVSQMLDNQKCYIQMCKNSSQILQMLSQFNQGVSCSTQVLELQSVSEDSDSSRSSTSSASSSPTSMSDEPPLVIWAEPIMTCQIISTTNHNQGCDGVRRLPPGVRPGEDKGKVSPENCSSTSSASSKPTTSPAPNPFTQQTTSPAPIPGNQQISDRQGRDPDAKFSTQTNFSEAMMKISKAADTIRQARQMLSCLANSNELNNNNDPDQHKEVSDSSHSGQARAVISTSATGAAPQPKPLRSPHVTEDDGQSRSDPKFPEPILVKTAVSPTDVNSFTDAECSVTPKSVTDDSRALSFTDSGISRSTANVSSRVNEMQSSEFPRNYERQQMSRLRANLFAERMGWSSNMSQHALQASRIVRYPRTYGPIYRRPTTTTTTEHANRTQQFSSLISQHNQEQNLPNPQTTSPSAPPSSKIIIQNSCQGTIGESDARDQPHRGGGDVPESVEKVHVAKFVHRITLKDLKDALDSVLKSLGKPDCWSANSTNLNDPQTTTSKVGSNGFMIAPFDFTCAPTAPGNVGKIADRDDGETLAALPADSDCRASPVYEAVCDGREHGVCPAQPNLVRSSHSRVWEGGGGQNENGRRNKEGVQGSAVETIGVKMDTSENDVCGGESGNVLTLPPKMLASETENCAILLENEGEPRSQICYPVPFMPCDVHDECGDSASCEVNSQSLDRTNALGVYEGLGDVSEMEIDVRSRVLCGDHSTACDGREFETQPQSSTPSLEIPSNHYPAVPDHNAAGPPETASPDFVFGRHDYLFREEQWPTGRSQPTGRTTPTHLSRVEESSPVSVEQESSSTDGCGAEIALKIISNESRTGEPKMFIPSFQPREEKGQRRPGSAWRERQDDTYAADRSAFESENGGDSGEESKATPFYVGKITGNEIVDCTSSIADAVKKNSYSVKSQQSISGDKLNQVEITDESGDNPLFDDKSEDKLIVRDNQTANLEAGEEGGSPDVSEASSVTVKSVSIGMSISSAIKGFVSCRRVQRRPVRTHFHDRKISEFRARPAELETETAVVESTREAGSAADVEKLEPSPNTCVIRVKSNIFETADAAQESPHVFVSRSGTILKSILSRPKSPRVVTSLRDIEETDGMCGEPDVISLTRHSVERKVTWDATSKCSGDHVSPTVSTSPSFTKQTECVTSDEVADTLFPPPAKPGFFQRIRRLFKACIPSWGR